MGRVPGIRVKKAGGEPRKSEGPVGECLIGVRVGYTSKRQEGILLVHLNAARSHSGEGKKGNWWQEVALSHWCTWLPG